MPRHPRQPMPFLVMPLPAPRCRNCTNRDRVSPRSTRWCASSAKVDKPRHILRHRSSGVEYVARLTRDVEAIGRLAAEAQVLRGLAGEPHIVRLHEIYVQSIDMWGGKEFVEIFEKVPGHSLAECLRTPQLIGPQQFFTGVELCEIERQLLVALSCVHRHGLIHRDIKPSNIMLSRNADGSLHVTLIDFGIARSMTQATGTGTMQMKGTLDYMSPEQIRGYGITAATDLHGAGLVLLDLAMRRQRTDSILLQPPADDLANLQRNAGAYLSADFLARIAWMLGLEPAQQVAGRELRVASGEESTAAGEGQDEDAQQQPSTAVVKSNRSPEALDATAYEVALAQRNRELGLDRWRNRILSVVPMEMMLIETGLVSLMPFSPGWLIGVLGVVGGVLGLVMPVQHLIGWRAYHELAADIQRTRLALRAAQKTLERIRAEQQSMTATTPGETQRKLAVLTHCAAIFEAMSQQIENMLPLPPLTRRGLRRLQKRWREIEAAIRQVATVNLPDLILKDDAAPHKNIAAIAQYAEETWQAVQHSSDES